MRLGLLFVATAAMVVTACASDRTIATTRVMQIGVPDSLLSCPPAPTWPEGDYTQRDVAALVVALHERGEACAASIDAIRTYLTAAGSP